MSFWKNIEKLREFQAEVDTKIVQHETSSGRTARAPRPEWVEREQNIVAIVQNYNIDNVFRYMKTLGYMFWIFNMNCMVLYIIL